MHQINKLFGEKLHMVNIGVETFYQDMLSQKEAGTQDIEVIHVDWKPVAGGNKKLAGMLGMLKLLPTPALREGDFSK